MQLDEILSRLERERGAKRAVVIPDDLFDEVVAEERTVSAVGGNMPVIPTGMEDCISRNTRVCVFASIDFELDDSIMMKMLDQDGNLIGHDIPYSEIPEYQKKENVMFISDNFIMYSDAPMEGSPVMEMLSQPYHGKSGWMDWADAVIWFPATTSSDMLRRHFGEYDKEYATGVVAFNL